MQAHSWPVTNTSEYARQYRRIQTNTPTSAPFYQLWRTSSPAALPPPPPPRPAPPPAIAPPAWENTKCARIHIQYKSIHTNTTYSPCGRIQHEYDTNTARLLSAASFPSAQEEGYIYVGRFSASRLAAVVITLVVVIILDVRLGAFGARFGAFENEMRITFLYYTSRARTYTAKAAQATHRRHDAPQTNAPHTQNL